MAKQYEQFEKDGKLNLQEMLKFDRLKKLNQRMEHILSAHYKDFGSTLFKAMGETYKEGYYLTGHAMEMHIKKKIGYRAVRPETFKAMLDNPVNGLTLNQRLQQRRAYIIAQIQRQITLGLQNNESYSTMAKRLKGELEGDAIKAMRIVRTEGHRVQESAKHDAMDVADKNGVIMLKQWNTLEDERVRPEKGKGGIANHRKLNNKKIPMNQLFDDGLSKGPAPGQLPAAASSINCRCFLTYSVDRLEKKDLKDIERVTFDQWKKENIKEPDETKTSKPKPAATPKKEPVKKVVETPKEQKQPTAADAKDYNELLKYAKDQLKLKRLDLNSIPFDVAKGAVINTEQVFNKFPFLAGKVSLQTDTAEEMNGMIGFQFKGMIFVNEEEFADKNTMLQRYENDVKANWHPKGTNGFSIVTHELGHSVEWMMNQKANGDYYSSIIQEEVLNNLNLTPDDISAELGDYAASDPMEFFAEAFNEWMTSPQPRRVAAEFGKVLMKHIKQLGLT
jgi:hypothetical protein